MEYKIMAKSRYGIEEIDSTEDKKDAQYLKNEYQLAYGKDFYIYVAYDV